MDDRSMIELYFARDERAIKETADKYGKVCLRLAKNILTTIYLHLYILPSPCP